MRTHIQDEDNNIKRNGVKVTFEFKNVEKTNNK